MKLIVIGGGGVRSMFLAKSIAGRAEALGIDELVFMDNDPIKLKTYGVMAGNVVKRLAPKLKFKLTEDPIEAITDADYVITTIRVGGDMMRVRDERAALDRGILGQETTGAAGFSFAMRSIPILRDYCELIKKYAKPSVKVFNFTNPAGIVSQALRDMGYDFTYGICDAPSGMLHQFADLYNEPIENITAECYGINHLSFFNSIKLKGREIMKEIINNDDAYINSDIRFFDKQLLNDLGCVVNEYLYYYYYPEKAIKNILATARTRGEIIAEINRDMTAELQSIDKEKDFEKALKVFEHYYGLREDNYMANETGIKRKKAWEFDIYSKDQGGYAGVALRYIELENSKGSGEMILCIPNNNSIDGLEADDIVEITCTVSAKGCKPHRMHNLSEINMELVRRVKLYERYAAKAIVKRDKKLAIFALLLHPLVNSYSIAKELIEEYITLNKKYSDGWK